MLGTVSCKEEVLDENSIFQPSVNKQNDFDKWIYENYTLPYNISLKYHMEDIESDPQYTLAPADFDKSVQLAHIVKYAWLEAYDEIAGIDFMRTYVPKILHFIGSAAYEENGTMILGTAEGGLKVTLYLVNNLPAITEGSDSEEIKSFLNTYYFKTMHHEFAHILHQTKNYDPDYDRISEGLYISGDWYTVSETDAHQAGFVSPYAMSEPREDIAEVTALYVVKSESEWADIISDAGEDGAAIINQKLDIVKKYMKNTWSIDMDQLRNIVQRRMNEVACAKIDLNSLN